MDDERIASAAGDGVDEADEIVPGIPVVDPDPCLHRHRQIDRAPHRCDAGGDHIRFFHQTCTEPRVLHPVTGTAHVQIDLVIAVFGGNFGAARQIGGTGAAKLESDGMFRCIEPEETVAIPVKDGAGGDHFRIEQDGRRNQAQEKPVVPVRAVHHRRDGNAPIKTG